MKVEAYLMFNGRCEEALEFYQKALGAELGMLLRFSEAPEQPPEGTLPPGFANKVMHSELKIGETRLYASDGCEAGSAKFEGFSLSLPVKTAAEADRYFNALADGGEVSMPLVQTFFSPRFGMLKDKFGVSWIVIVEQSRE